MEREALYRLYVDDGLSSSQIAKKIGRSQMTILRWLKKYSIPRRNYDLKPYENINGIDHKECSKCGELKPLKEFHVNKHHSDNLSTHCKKCINERHEQYKGNENKQSRKLNAHRRKARLAEVESTLTKYDWDITLEYFNHECAYCGEKEKLTIDHVIPIFKKGSHTINNVVPACGSCNSSKGISDMETWYQSKDFYSIERLKKIKGISDLLGVAI